MLRVYERYESSDATAPNDRPAGKRRSRCLAIGLLLLIAAMPSLAMANDGTGLAEATRLLFRSWLRNGRAVQSPGG